MGERPKKYSVDSSNPANTGKLSFHGGEGLVHTKVPHGRDPPRGILIEQTLGH